MTGPTTPIQLLDLAALELQQLGEAKTSPGQAAADAAALAEAWPVFLRAGTYLNRALDDRPASTSQPASPAALAAVGTTPASAQPGVSEHPAVEVPGRAVVEGSARRAAADRRLLRAAELLAAAADLVGTRDRRALTVEQAAVDAALAARCLVTGAAMVCQATAPDLTLLSTTASAATAATRWSAALPAEPTGSRTGSLHDPVALPVPAALTGPDAADRDPSARLVVAAVRWQQTATMVTADSVPAAGDLQHMARTAGRLLAVSQVLLRAHPPGTSLVGSADGQRVDDLAARLRHAGLAWNHAGEQWQTLRTGGTPHRDLAQTSSTLAVAVDAVTCTGPRWASLPQVRSRLDPTAAIGIASTLLAVTQTLAEQHAVLIDALARASALYSPARRLPPTLERWDARLAGRWVPVSVADCAQLVGAYQALPAVTAAARLSYTAATGQPIPAERLQPLQLTPPPMTPAATSLPPGPAIGQPAGSGTLATRRWQALLDELDPRLTADPHYPALAAALDRVSLAGTDAAASVRLAAAEPLPADHPARVLHSRLTDTCPAAITPYTTVPTSPAPPARAVPEAAAARRPAAHRPGPRR